MNCPKCGNEIIDTSTCSACGVTTHYCNECENEWQEQPEPPTAEKLLWLERNCAVLNFQRIGGICGSIYIGVVVDGKNEIKSAVFQWEKDNDNIELKSDTEAIDKAYEWARKEVTE